MNLPPVSKRLFSDTDGWTKEANDFAIEIEQLLRPIFERKAAEGYSMRELAYIVHSAADHAHVTAILMSQGRVYNVKGET